MSEDNKPSIKELLAELAALGVNVEILKEAGLSEEQLREFAEKVRALLKKQKSKRA